MSTTITIRTDDALRKALVQKAESQGTTLSALIRALLEAAVGETSLESRVGHLKGRLRLSGGGGESWRERLRERNWRS